MHWLERWALMADPHALYSGAPRATRHRRLVLSEGAGVALERLPGRAAAHFAAVQVEDA
jgi:hypothetical protein